MQLPVGYRNQITFFTDKTEQDFRNDPYENVFRTVENTRYFDPASMFKKEDPKIVMMDNIHPTPFGHQILAEAIQKEIRDWLP